MRSTGIMALAARRGFFYGWVVVGVGFVMQATTGVATQGVSIYVAPLQREFGWSSASIGLARSLQQLDALFGPLTGSLVDRLGPRRVMLTGVLLYAAAFVMLGRLGDLPSFYFASLLMAIANSCVGFLVVGTAINHWFKRRRTTAIGIAAIGFALSGAALLPLLVRVQDAFGWREAAIVTAIGVLAIGLPAVHLVRGAPERYGLRPDGDAVDAESTLPTERAGSSPGGYTLGEALRVRAFWLVTLGGSTVSIVVASVIVYQFAYIESIATREIASLVLVVMNVFNIAGRAAGGHLGDRFPKHDVMAVVIAGGAAAVALLAVADSASHLLAYAALFGLCWGIRAPIYVSLMADYFGRRSFGRIAGTIQSLALPLALAGPVASGGIIDVAGYRPAFAWLLGVSAVGALSFFLAERPRPR